MSNEKLGMRRVQPLPAPACATRAVSAAEVASPPPPQPLSEHWDIGIQLVMMGHAEALQQATTLARHPSHAHQAVALRMLHAYWQARPQQGDRLRANLLRSIDQDTPLQNWLPALEAVEAAAHASAEDLPRLRRCYAELDAANSLGAEIAGITRSTLRQYIQGECDRLEQRPDKALAMFSQALQRVVPSKDLLWAHMCSASVHALLELKRHQEAVDAAETYLDAARTHHDTFAIQRLSLALALALAWSGPCERSNLLIDSTLQEMQTQGIAGLNLGLAHETRARLALGNRDNAKLATDLAFCAVHLNAKHNPTGAARCKRLRRQQSLVASPPQCVPAEHTTRNSPESLAQLFSAFQSPHQRSALALHTLRQYSGAHGGALGLVQANQAPVIADCGLEGQRPLVLDRLHHLLEAGGADAGPLCWEPEATLGSTDPLTATEQHLGLTLSHMDASGCYRRTAVAVLLLPAPAKSRAPVTALLTELSQLVAAPGHREV